MKTIDARGLLCPIPVIETKKVIAQFPQEGGVVTVLVDNSIACQNLNKMCEQKGFACKVEKKGERDYAVTISVGEACELCQPDPIEAPAATANKDLAVAIGRDSMGGGDESLGKILIKGFVYSLLNLEKPPKAVLFFNSGVKLTIEGANTLDDLRALKAKGTAVFVCGTCVDFFGCKDKVAVGEITNMYNIVEVLSAAGSVINI